MITNLFHVKEFPWQIKLGRALQEVGTEGAESLILGKVNSIPFPKLTDFQQRKDFTVKYFGEMPS